MAHTYSRFRRSTFILLALSMVTVIGAALVGDLTEAKGNWIVDDGDTPYMEKGNWQTVQGFGYGEHERVARGKKGSRSLAQWTFAGIPPGTYDVYVTWQVPRMRAPLDKKATFTVGEQKKKLARVSVDQRKNPHGSRHEGWQKIGSWHFSHTPITIQLTPSAPNRSVLADAILLSRSQTPPWKNKSSLPAPQGTGKIVMPHPASGSGASSSDADTTSVPPHVLSGTLRLPLSTTAQLTVERVANSTDRYIIRISDPTGLRKLVLTNIHGKDFGGGNGDCPNTLGYRGGVGVTLQPSDFPIIAIVTDCAGQQFMAQANPPPPPSTPPTNPPPSVTTTSSSSASLGPPNTTLTVTRSSPDSYKYYEFSIGDPDGVASVSIVGIDGTTFQSFSGITCVTTFQPGIKMILSSQFPLTLTGKDCAGNPFSVLASEPPPPPQDSASAANITLTVRGPYSHGYEVTMNAQTSLKDSWVKKADGSTLATMGNYGPCGAPCIRDSRDGGNTTLSSSDFPLTLTVIDSADNQFSVTANMPSPP